MKTNIISDYKSLPIGKYLDICKISKSDMEDIDRQVAIVAILTGMPEDDVLQLPIADYAQLSAKIGYLNTIPEKVDRIADKYTIGKWELIPTTDVRNITTAQYIDFQTFVKQLDVMFVELVSCFLIPKGHKYNTGYDVIEIQEAIRENLSTYDVIAIVNFFFTRFRESIISSLNCSESELKKVKKDNPVREQLMAEVRAMKTLLGLNGDGSQM